MRLIFHAIDLAVVNSWIEYKNACTNNDIRQSDVMDLLHFKMRLAETLIKSSFAAKKRGRPSTSTDVSAEATPQRKSKIAERQPFNEVRYDNSGHLPELSDSSKPITRCKNEKCTSRTHTYCIKCNVHLCFTTKRNCFRAYHTK